MELSVLIVLCQLAGAWLRWLAFSRKVSIEVKNRLWTFNFIWGGVSVALYSFVFDEFGIDATPFKAIVMLGCLPYFLIGMAFIPWGFTQHLFVLGMNSICSLLQHSIAAAIILTTFEGKSEAELILLQVKAYLLLFVIFVPILRPYFLNLLPSRELFNLRPMGIYIAVLPIVIVSGHLIRIADDVLVHSWTERLSRIYLPIVFLFFYHYILSTAKNFYERQRIEENERRLEEQLSALKKYNNFIQENQKQVSIMRHDLRHSYNLIYAMLESGNIAKAREHIIAQKFLLEASTVQTFCQSPLINAALTIYLRRADEVGIQVFHKINLPNKLETAESDFALLLSNIFENVITGSLKQEPTAREMSIIIQHVNKQCIMEISFRFNSPLAVDDDHLPMNLEENRGMDSLRDFVKKYDAWTSFSQHGDKVNLLMYWNENGGG